VKKIRIDKIKRYHDHLRDGVAISYLGNHEQFMVVDRLEKNKLILSQKQAEKLRIAFEQNSLTKLIIDNILLVRDEYEKEVKTNKTFNF